jgi:hypothetical protein
VHHDLIEAAPRNAVATRGDRLYCSPAWPTCSTP